MTDVPLVELHLHLEGAAPPDFIRRLADEKKIRLDGVFGEDGSYVYEDFSHFLKVYEEATKVLTGPDEFFRLTETVLQQSADQGVIYTECFLSPDFCGGGDLEAWRDYVAAMEEAAAGVWRAGGSPCGAVSRPFAMRGRSNPRRRRAARPRRQGVSSPDLVSPGPS